MKYFRAIPNIEVSNITGVNTLATNIMMRTELLPSLLDNPALFYQYDMQDGDTPETIAAKYYGDSYRYWLVMYGNQIFDPQWDIPLSNYNFDLYLNDKYANAANTCLNLTMLSGGSGDYQENEIVYQGTSLNNSTASGQVIYWNSTTRTLLVSDVSGNFEMSIPVIGVQSDVIYNLNYTTPVSVLAYTQEQTHEYQKIVKTLDTGTGTTSINTFVIDQDTYNNTPNEDVGITYTIPKGYPVSVTISRNKLSIYDYETQTNEAKRSINIIDVKYAIPLENQLISLLK